MAISNFIGEVWSAQILQSLQKALVYGQAGVINRDYEGEIKGKGDTVRITAHGPITIANYDKTAGLGDPEELDDASTTLNITQAKAFNFRIEDIDKAQMNVKLMESATRDAAYQLADVADQYVAGIMADDAIAQDAAALDLDTVLTRDMLIDLKTALDEANAPKAGRWVILPPWVTGFMLKEGLLTHSVDWSGVEGAMKNGQITRLFGFDILESNNVPEDTGSYTVLAGVSQAVTFADSVNETEAYRPDKFFADALRGLHCYGAKVVRPDCLVSVAVSDNTS
jgi:hypothetical protein